MLRIRKKGKEIMNDDKNVSYLVYESTQARNERNLKRLTFLILLLIMLLFGTNVFWIVYESQFTTYTVEQDGKGFNNINTGSHSQVAYN